MYVLCYGGGLCKFVYKRYHFEENPISSVGLSNKAQAVIALLYRNNVAADSGQLCSNRRLYRVPAASERNTQSGKHITCLCSVLREHSV